MQNICQAIRLTLRTNVGAQAHPNNNIITISMREARESFSNYIFSMHCMKIGINDKKYIYIFFSFSCFPGRMDDSAFAQPHLLWTIDCGHPVIFMGMREKCAGLPATKNTLSFGDTHIQLLFSTMRGLFADKLESIDYPRKMSLITYIKLRILRRVTSNASFERIAPNRCTITNSFKDVCLLSRLHLEIIINIMMIKHIMPDQHSIFYCYIIHKQKINIVQRVHHQRQRTNNWISGDKISHQHGQKHWIPCAK